jgi:hypothetical protein
MIRIIDTYSKINTLFDKGNFNFSKWENYINEIYKDSANIFKGEINEYIDSGKYTFKKDFLPIINAVYENSNLDILHDSFSVVTSNLNENIISKFGKELNVDIVLYLGLCNGAGWVTKINGSNTVLLGIEKILELNWFDLKSMYGLVYHELGHVYQKQYGFLEQESDDNKRNFVWQLFTEGIATYFEQALVGDFSYYHQDTNGWKKWCEDNFTEILIDFNHDLPTMTRFNQRYFGDWCNYKGKGDVGYYLGTRFVHHLIKIYTFNKMISFNIDLVYNLYVSFIREHLNL